MKIKSRVYLSVFMFTLTYALVATGRVMAQQPTAAPASATALDQLTAPIALYPDALVIQILTASRNVESLTSFADWLKKNASLKGSELQDAAQKAGFDAALVALAPFPQVIQMMVEKPDWTKALGQAVTADKKGVSDSIQRLRAQAAAAGNLKTTSQQTVQTATNSTGQTVIVIEPANPQVIYVPVYNTQTVYVESSSSADAAGAAVVGFTMGVIVGSAYHNHYYYDYDDYWEDREDYYEDRAENARENQDQRQSDRQTNQDERQTGREENQGQRQSSAQANQSQRQSTAPASQGQRQASAAPVQSQSAATPAQRQSAATTSSWGGGQTASRSSGMSSGRASSYQSGSVTRSQSSRGSASMSSSRGGGRSGGRGGGGRGR